MCSALQHARRGTARLHGGLASGTSFGGNILKKQEKQKNLGKVARGFVRNALKSYRQGGCAESGPVMDLDKPRALRVPIVQGLGEQRRGGQGAAASSSKRVNIDLRSAVFQQYKCKCL